MARNIIDADQTVRTSFNHHCTAVRFVCLFSPFAPELLISRLARRKNERLRRASLCTHRLCRSPLSTAAGCHNTTPTRSTHTQTYIASPRSHHHQRHRQGTQQHSAVRSQLDTESSSHTFGLSALSCCPLSTLAAPQLPSFTHPPPQQQINHG